MQSSITSRVILGEEGAENAKKLISVKTSCRRQFFKKIEITNCGLYLVFAPYAHTLKIPCFAPEINSKVSASFCLDVQTRITNNLLERGPGEYAKLYGFPCKYFGKEGAGD